MEDRSRYVLIMEANQFKSTLKEALVSSGFSKRGSYYYRDGDGVICVVGLQKSNFASEYFINVGYVIKTLRPSLTQPRDVDGDVRSRFGFEEDGKVKDNFNLYMSLEQFRFFLDSNIRNLIVPVGSVEGLKGLLKQNPILLYQTRFDAKKYLGLE